jgi:hypothetical protein
VLKNVSYQLLLLLSRRRRRHAATAPLLMPLALVAHTGTHKGIHRVVWCSCSDRRKVGATDTVAKDGLNLEQPLAWKSMQRGSFSLHKAECVQECIQLRASRLEGWRLPRSLLCTLAHLGA